MFPRFLTALLLTAALLPVANASAQSVYVVHGIPGDDLGLPRELPVDVCQKDGTEVTADFKFGEIRGPLSLPPPPTSSTSASPPSLPVREPS